MPTLPNPDIPADQPSTSLNHPLSGQETLFTRQRHEADRAGLHWDYRLVHGDKAYSWATKKEMPGPGKAILLFEQPVHTSHYALSEEVVIPKGSYGSGKTTLDWVRKAKVEGEGGKLVVHVKDGGRFLLKKLEPGKYGDKSWLFKNLGDVGNKYLEKIAKDSPGKTKLQPRHEQFLKKLETTDGLIQNWSTGAGKTVGFLTAAERALKKNKDGRVLVVAPASLVTNIHKEIAKHGLDIDPSRLDAMSYEMATNRADDLKKNKYLLAIADESHRLRTADTKRVRSLRGIISGADKRILATATSTFNHPGDIASLVNIASGKDLLPEDNKAFENRYLKKVKKSQSFKDRILGREAEEAQVLQKEKELGRIFKEHVHEYDSADDPEAAKFFPKVTEETVETEMSPDQLKAYKFMEGKLPFWIRMKVRHNLPLDKQEKMSLNSFSTGVRQVSTGYRNFSQNPEKVGYSPKVEEAVSRLKKRMAKDKNYRGLVYSEYLDSGVKEYSRKLEEEGIKHHVYTGALSRPEKDQMVKDYNEGKVKALLISGAGGEGLDLKGSKHIQVMGSAFNPSKIKQVIGRGARFKSHEHLPEEERTVHVERFHSVHPKNFFGKGPTSIDTYLANHSEDKQQIFDQIKKVMKGNS